MYKEFPQLISVETTNRCNAKCSFFSNNARERRIRGKEFFEEITNHGKYSCDSVIDRSVLEAFNKKAPLVWEFHRKGNIEKTASHNRCNLFWPSFSHLPPQWKIKNSLDFYARYLKNRSLKLNKINRNRK